MRIVVVDDSAIARRVFVRLATAAGHTVVAESAGADDALVQVARHAPDAIVIDGRLPPHGAAPNLIERLRGLRPTMRIVVVASLDERELVAAAAAAGASAALLRPLVPSRVSEALGAPQKRAADTPPSSSA